MKSHKSTIAAIATLTAILGLNLAAEAQTRDFRFDKNYGDSTGGGTTHFRARTSRTDMRRYSWVPSKFRSEAVRATLCHCA